MDLYIASTSDGFVLDVSLLAWRIATASISFPLGFLSLDAFCSPLALVLFCLSQEDSPIMVVLIPMSCALIATLFFYLRACFFGIDVALVRSLFTCSMAASNVLKASMTSSPSSTNTLGNCRPFS